MGSIQLKDVRKAFGAVSIINGVNLNIENGEFAVFVGSYKLREALEAAAGGVTSLLCQTVLSRA